MESITDAGADPKPVIYRTGPVAHVAGSLNPEADLLFHTTSLGGSLPGGGYLYSSIISCNLADPCNYTTTTSQHAVTFVYSPDTSVRFAALIALFDPYIKSGDSLRYAIHQITATAQNGAVIYVGGLFNTYFPVQRNGISCCGGFSCQRLASHL